MFGALAKGVSEAKKGYASYNSSGYVFPESVTSVSLKDMLATLAAAGANTELDNETVENKSIYFTSYSINGRQGHFGLDEIRMHGFQLYHRNQHSDNT